MERKFTIEADALYKEDYQLKMLKLNPVEGMIPLRGMGLNGKSQYIYQVSGKISLQAMYNRGKMTHDDIDTLLRNLLATLDSLDSHLLDADRLLLSEEYIFYGEERFYFCFYPLKNGTLDADFHRLSDFMVKCADYDDELCIQKAFHLYQESQAENFDLKKLLCGCLCLKNEKETTAAAREQEGSEPAEPVMREAPEKYQVKAEKRGLTGTVKRLFRSRKARKWGDFDGLLLEEEL